MKLASCAALLCIAGQSAGAQKIGLVERASERGMQFDILVVRVPVQRDTALAHIRRALDDQSLTLRFTSDSVIEASTNRARVCESAPAKVPFVIPGGAPPRRTVECRLTVSIRMQPDSTATSLRLSGSESWDDNDLRSAYRVRHGDRSWQIIEKLANAIARP